MTKERLKSPILWLGLASLFAMFMGNYGLWDYIGMDEPFFRGVVNLVLTILGGLGIINNPTDLENW